MSKFLSASVGPAMILLSGAAPIPQRAILTVPHAPRAVVIDGRRQLRYELYISNRGGSGPSPTRIEAIDAASGAVIGALAGEALRRSVATVGHGDALVVYWQLEFPPARPVPARLRHRMVIDGVTVDGGDTAPLRPALPQLGSPLRGGPWAAAYDPGLARGHRRAIYVTDGAAHIPGRYAIDWFYAGGNDGRGAEVLAVADATVAAVRDDMEEAAGVSVQSIPLADGTGNFVALHLADGSFAVYEHLARGIPLRVGQRVARGQVIGHVGATGHASRPHLHFHVADGLSSLASEGLPFRLTGATIIGRYADVFAASSGGSWTAVRPYRLSARTGDMPAPNVVVRFD